MKNLIINATEFCPEIILDHQNKIFSIKGNSRPEDVREIYFPVVEWINNYRLFIKEEINYFTEDDPLVFQFDLDYFNSSSAKFLFDIVEALKQLKEDGTKIGIAWIWDEEDIDMREAGEDLEYLAEIDFAFISK